MGNISKSRINISRKRYNFRQNITYKHVIIILSCIILILLSYVLFKNFNKENVKTTVNIYKNEEINNENNENNENNDANNIKDPDGTSDNQEEKETEVNSTSNIRFTILGEIMMGAEVTKNLSYSYSLAFKDIYSDTRMSDFTYSTLATPITTLEKISGNAKSKYLVTKDITNAFSALGIDAISIATDHILDFDEIIFKNTITTLESSNISVAGRKDTPVYLEKNGKKIAIVATNNVFIGTSSKYTNNGISIYNSKTLKNDIEIAKQNADFVIVDVHWGRQNIYGVTTQMSTIAKKAIDYGANLVIGSHALGVFPIVTYKDTPIIYSCGTLITNSELTLAKEGYIFDLNINENMKLKSIEMTPIYIKDKKEVLKYINYAQDKAETYLEQFNKWHIDNGLNSSIRQNKIIIEF